MLLAKKKRIYQAEMIMILYKQIKKIKSVNHK